MRSLVLVALVLAASLALAAAVELADPQPRDPAVMQQAAEEIGVQQTDALVEFQSVAAARMEPNYFFDEGDAAHHVYVEAQSESGVSSEQAQQQQQQPTAAALATSVTTPEQLAADDARVAAAVQSLKQQAHAEHVAEYNDYRMKMVRHRYNRAVAKARQSKKFERALPPETPQQPHPASTLADRKGDRNYNTLFPAATAKSDGKAPSQLHDFQHRGNGDLYYNHVNLVEHANGVQEAADAAAEGEGELAVDAQAPAEGEAEGEQVVEDSADAAADEAVEAAGDAAMSADLEGEVEGEVEGEEGALAEGEDAAPAVTDSEENGENVPPAEEAPSSPVTALEPCASECDAPGAWRSASCQDCLVRGMVNGWIVKSIAEKARGYNYVHYARNKCVAYANELRLRSADVKGAPFAACFFQKVHESCNL